MRHGRAKQARKTLQFFQRSIGLRPPFPVLVDGTFVVAFFSHKLPMATRVERLLQTHALHWLTTQSVVDELATLADKTTDAEMAVVLREAHEWVQQHCRVVASELVSAAAAPPLDTATQSASTSKSKNNHKKDTAKNKLEELSDASRDMLAVLTDCNGILASNGGDHGSRGDNHEKVSSPLLLASQDEALLHAARQAGTVPVIRLARGTVLLLEQPSSVAQRQASAEERQKWTVRGSLQEQEKVLVDLVKQQERQQQKSQQQGEQSGGAFARTSRYKRKAKGPNPLSCKSKKKKSS
jgi:rRNA-processing protein FCF1